MCFGHNHLEGYSGTFRVICLLWETFGGYWGLVGFSGLLGVFWPRQSRGLFRDILGYMLALGDFGGLVGVSGISSRAVI